MRNVQVLVSTMNQTDYSLLKKMNIQTDAIVINQCSESKFDEFLFNGHKIKWISLNERGVGLSRNTAFMHATGDILIFADDDVVYNDGYEKKILNFFKKYNCSVAVFNITSLNLSRPEYADKYNHRLNLFNCLKYGAARIAIKRESLLKSNIFFSLLFGGGAVYQAGEDNLFLTTCIRRGLKVYASKKYIGTVAQQDSTWFKGYNEKYYFDRGALFYAMYGKNAQLMLLLMEIHSMKRAKSLNIIDRLKLQYRGIDEFKKNL